MKNKSMITGVRYLLVGSAFLLSLAMGQIKVNAASYIWGGGTSGNWDVLTNWSPNTAFPSGVANTAYFNASATGQTVTLGEDISIGGIGLQSGGSTSYTTTISGATGTAGVYNTLSLLATGANGALLQTRTNSALYFDNINVVVDANKANGGINGVGTGSTTVSYGINSTLTLTNSTKILFNNSGNGTVNLNGALNIANADTVTYFEVQGGTLNWNVTSLTKGTNTNAHLKVSGTTGFGPAVANVTGTALTTDIDLGSGGGSVATLNLQNGATATGNVRVQTVSSGIGVATLGSTVAGTSAATYSGQIIAYRGGGTSTVSFNAAAGNVVYFTNTLQNGAAAGTDPVFHKTGDGRVVLTGQNSNTSAILVDQGTLELAKTVSAGVALSGSTTVNAGGTLKITDNIGAKNEIGDTVTLTLNGGTFSGGIGNTETLGTLSVTADSILALGLGTKISFAASNLLTWTGNLNLVGAPTDITQTSLRFGTDATGLTAAELGRILLNGNALTGLQLDTQGYLLVPEPATSALLISAFMGLGMIARRRR